MTGKDQWEENSYFIYVFKVRTLQLWQKTNLFIDKINYFFSINQSYLCFDYNWKSDFIPVNKSI